MVGQFGRLIGKSSTFNKLATVGLAGGDLESDDMTLLDRSSWLAYGNWQQMVFTNLSLVEKLDRDTNCRSHVGGCVITSWGWLFVEGPWWF